MSSAASNYVKHLKVAPNGERITPAERATLWYLADGHAEDNPVGLRATVLLADDVGVAPRELFHIFAELERKGVLLSAPDAAKFRLLNAYEIDYFFADPSLTRRSRR